ncbi:MAG: TIGR01212 family radical SAM protein [Lachnospiraceae bacterium]|nr:TIGR01212 family radical SAM protein [Lachnospiraceae bacterium]
MNYLSLNTYLKNTFGCKVYKLAIDGGFTCPNRDGSLDTRGCIFCSGFGSGDFAASRNQSITDQIEEAKLRVKDKIKDGKYIAYFQAFTNTYAPVNELESKYMEAINHPDIVAISIGTRPDCIPEEVLSLLEKLNKIKPVWVELGLQTIHKKSSEFIRRGYDLEVYNEAVKNLKARGIYVITHIILGLPGETQEMMLESVRYVCKSPSCDGIKLQLLHIIHGTDLAYLYENRHNLSELGVTNHSFSKNDLNLMADYECMDLESYVDVIKKCISIVPNNIAIHRMTGDGDKKTLIAPLYSGDKKRVLNAINKALSN